MNFKLYDFIKESEFLNYKITRNEKYDYITGKSSTKEIIIPMFIYKKTLKIIAADVNQGLYEHGQLNGKCLKEYELKKGDKLEVEKLTYRVTEIMPRLHADFIEFTLELVRYD